VGNVRMLYELALGQMVGGRVVRDGINCFTNHAPPAYVSAVAAIEAYVNEISFASMTRVLIPDSPLWTLDLEWLEKLDLKLKLTLVPQLLFGKSLRNDTQPYQDMVLLIKIRNDLIHYKMKAKVPSYVADLSQRGIAIRSNAAEVDYLWVHKISSSEGIRWAHNTMCRTAQALFALMPENLRGPFAGLAGNFVEIDETLARGRLEGVSLSYDGG